MPNYHEHSSAFPRIVYKRIPVYDLPSSDLLSHADSIVGFVSLGLHHGSVLVHCREGVSRSTTAVAFFLIRRLRMTCEEALALCRERKADVQPIPAFSAQLDKYEAKCRRMGIIGKSRKRPKLVMGESTVPAETGKKEKKARVVGPAHATCSSIIGPSPKPLLARLSIAPPPMADQVCAKSNIGALLDSTTSKRSSEMTISGLEGSIGPEFPPVLTDNQGTAEATRTTIGPQMPPK